MTQKLGLFVAALVVACLAVGCGSTTAPGGTGVNLGDLAGWFGTYTRVDTLTICLTQAVVGESGSLVLCSKSGLLNPASFGMKLTSQSVSPTHLSYTCSGTVFFEGDSTPVTIVASADRSGDQILATGRISSSDPGGLVCADFRYHLARTSVDTSNCDVNPFGKALIRRILRAQGR